MAVDVDVWDRAAAELAMRGIDLQGLYDAPDAVVVDSGRQGHGKLLYAMPFGMALPSKKFMDSDPSGKRYNYLDLRCSTHEALTVQDVLPPSIHPDTLQPYRWAGMGHWTRLPQIPQSLLAFWVASMERQEPQQADVPSTADWEEIRSALAYISPDVSREEWVKVGMALHHLGTETGQETYAAQLWDQWSQESGKYPGSRDMATQWRSFRSDKSTKVRIGSLYRMASENGWSRPVPDASSFFTAASEITEPVQLTNELRPPPPELDLDLVPAILRRRADEIARGVGCDPMVPLFAGLATVSGALDARTRLQLKPGFKVPPVLWVMTIGDPADKKSPGSRPMFSVLNKLEEEDRPRYRQALQVFEALQARHEAAKKAFLDAAKDPEQMLAGEMPEGYGDAPVEPRPLKIVVQDITSQKLVRHAADQPRGLLCHLDEMHSWAEKVTDPRSGEARSAWTQAYESERYEMDRVGAGTISADNYAVSIYGNIQPHVFSDVVKSMSSDGLLQRFIPIVLRHGHTRKGSPIPEALTNIAEFEQMVRVVFGLPAMTYALSPEAAAEFDRFQDWYETQRKDERLLRSGPVFLTAFGKLEGMLGRLALIWHVMENPYSLHVSGDVMRRCADLIRSFIVPAMRYTYDSDLGGVSGFDQWMADHIIQHADATEISLAEIKSSARRRLDKVNQWTATEMILGSMHPLEKAGWVARMDDGSEINRGRAQWAINPALREMFSHHRAEVIAAKQRQMDNIYRLSTKEKPTVHGYERTGTTGD